MVHLDLSFLGKVTPVDIGHFLGGEILPIRAYRRIPDSGISSVVDLQPDRLNSTVVKGYVEQCPSFFWTGNSRAYRDPALGLRLGTIPEWDGIQLRRLVRCGGTGTQQPRHNRVRYCHLIDVTPSKFAPE